MKMNSLVATAFALTFAGAAVLFSQAPSTSPAPKSATAPAAKSAAVAKPPTGARGFATAKEATEALIEAAAAFDEPTLLAIFGPDGKDLVTTDDPVRDKSYAAAFAARAREGHSVVVQSTNPN